MKTQKPWVQNRVAAAVAIAVTFAVVLSGCGAKEYPGTFTVQNGDSNVAVGEEYRYTDVTAKCSEKGGQITLTLTANKTGNTFTTTQPESGSGYAGGTLKLADGQEITWTPVEGLNEEIIQKANSHPDVRGEARTFQSEHQEGTPVIWSDTGVADISAGLRVMSDAPYEEQETLHEVSAAGQIDCSGGSEE